MRSIVQFSVSRDDTTYTAEAQNAPIVTQAATFEELQDNIREAVALYFKDERPSDLGFTRAPAILTNFEITLSTHGAEA